MKRNVAEGLRARKRLSAAGSRPHPLSRSIRPRKITGLLWLGGAKGASGLTNGYGIIHGFASIGKSDRVFSTTAGVGAQTPSARRIAENSRAVINCCSEPFGVLFARKAM